MRSSGTFEPRGATPNAHGRSGEPNKLETGKNTSLAQKRYGRTRPKDLLQMTTLPAESTNHQLPKDGMGENGFWFAAYSLLTHPHSSHTPHTITPSPHHHPSTPPPHPIQKNILKSQSTQIPGGWPKTSKAKLPLFQSLLLVFEAKCMARKKKKIATGDPGQLFVYHFVLAQPPRRDPSDRNGQLDKSTECETVSSTCCASFSPSLPRSNK